MDQEVAKISQAEERSENGRKGVEDGGETLDVVQFRDCGTEEKGGSRGSNVELLFGSDGDGWDQE